MLEGQVPILQTSMMGLGAVMGITVLSLSLTLESLSCQVNDAQSLVTQISSTMKGKWLPDSSLFTIY